MQAEHQKYQRALKGNEEDYGTLWRAAVLGNTMGQPSEVPHPLTIVVAPLLQVGVPQPRHRWCAPTLLLLICPIALFCASYYAANLNRLSVELHCSVMLMGSAPWVFPMRMPPMWVSRVWMCGLEGPLAGCVPTAMA